MARRRDRFGALVSRVEAKTAETNRALGALAARIRADTALRDIFAQSSVSELVPTLTQSLVGQAFLDILDAFLDQYGHRETSLTISQPAWKDQPGIVLGIVKVLAGAELLEIESYQTWKHRRDELLTHSILGTRQLRGLFLKSLTNARCLFQIREDTHFYATLLQPLLRHVALELGRRLVLAGALDIPEDVFHVRLEELEPLGEPWPSSSEIHDRIRALIARRKAKRESLAMQPIFDTRLQVAESAKPVNDDALLSGFAGSPGRASGPARIIRDISEVGKLQPGIVLVAPVTNPAWTPLFLHAAAVVVDTGGLASHAAITAREYGVPAVMGTVNGTKKLNDGQWIQVDGSRGLVLKDPRKVMRF